MTDPLPSDLVAVGRVVDAYGVRGWVKVLPYNAPTESVLRTSRRWWLPDGRGVTVERARVHGASIVCKPAGSEDRDAALGYKGLELHVRRADFPQGRAGEFYWVDLVGCAVVTPEGAGLGTVEAVEDYGAHPILKTRDAQGRDRMIPFVGACVVEVDLDGRRIVADWPPDF